MPRSGSADALLAIRGGTLLPPARSERHFQIPHRARSALRGAQAMLGMFLLFLLGLQDAKLLEDRTGAAGRAAWFAVGWSLAVVCWGAMLYLFPLCMKWPSVRVLVVEMLADASALLILGTNGFALLSGMGDACPILKSAACDRYNAFMAFLGIDSIVWLAAIVNSAWNLYRGLRPKGLDAYEEDALLRQAMRRK